MYIRPAGRHLRCAGVDEFIAFLVAYLNLDFALLEARDRGLPSRANTVPLTELRSQEVPDAVLLWMLYQGHIEHWQSRGRGRNGSPAGSLLLTESSSFCLTD